MSHYTIKHDDDALCWVVAWAGERLAAFGTWDEAKEHVVECERFDAVYEEDSARYSRLPRDHYGM